MGRGLSKPKTLPPLRFTTHASSGCRRRTSTTNRPSTARRERVGLGPLRRPRRIRTPQELIVDQTLQLLHLRQTPASEREPSVRTAGPAARRPRRRAVIRRPRCRRHPFRSRSSASCNQIEPVSSSVTVPSPLSVNRGIGHTTPRRPSMPVPAHEVTVPPASQHVFWPLCGTGAGEPPAAFVCNEPSGKRKPARRHRPLPPPPSTVRRSSGLDHHGTGHPRSRPISNASSLPTNLLVRESTT